MKTLLVIVLVLVIVALVVVAVGVWRFGRRSYQRYTGLETQRASAKRARDAGVDRLKEAEQQMIRAQRELLSRGEHEDAQRIERLRVRLSTAADRHRFALHGYAPLGDANPIQETELAELQARDSETISDADLVKATATEVNSSATAGGDVDLGSLETAVDHLVTALDRRRALT